MIVARGLTKRFGRVLAVDGIDLTVDEGDRYGFLGPNGSGKTTTVRMLLGLVYATSGRIEVLGSDMPRHAATVLPEIGALVEGPAAYPHLSAHANLAIMDASGPRRTRTPRRSRRHDVGEALEQVGLGGVGRRPVKTFSLGMRQRLGLAGALLRRPRLLVLDEPTNGLDPQGIHEVRELLMRLNAQGATVFCSSHLLSEVEALCTRVGIMDRGRLVAEQSMEQVRRPTGRTLVRVDDVRAAGRLLGVAPAEGDGDRLVVPGSTVAAVTRSLVTAGLAVHEAVEERGTLEELVLSLTHSGSDRVDLVPPRGRA